MTSWVHSNLAGAITLAVAIMVIPSGGSWVASDHTSPARPSESGALSTPAILLGWSPRLDWPTYLGNPERTSFDQNESALAPGNVSGLTVAWTNQTPGPIESSPVVAEGRVFVSSWDGNVTAYNLTDGALDWRTSVGTSTFRSCGASGARGPTATPTITNGTLYIPGGDPYFYALNESTGEVEWKVSNLVNSPSSGDYNWGSALIYGDAAYYGLSSACGVPGSQGMVIMINLNGTTHKVTHKFAVVPAGNVLGGVWSTPAIDPETNLVWVTSGDGTNYGQSIFALNATTLTLVGAWQEPNPNLDYDFGAGPTLFHDANGRPMVAALNKNGIVYALNRSNVSATGWKPVWRVNVSWYDNVSQGQFAGDYDLAPSAFDGTDLYVGGGFARLSNGTNVAGSVTSIVPATGSVRWQVGTPGVVRAGVATANGLVFDAANQPDNRTTWFEVRSSATGRLLYDLHLNGTINAAPTFSGGVVLFGSGGWGPKGAGTLWALVLPMSARWAPLPGPAWPGIPMPLHVNVTGGSPPYAFRWTFGDGTPGSNLASPWHSFPSPGTFQVSVGITDGAGQTATLEANVTVADPPLSISNLTTTPAMPVVGAPMAVIVSTSGGWGPLTYSFAGLPSGCTSENRSTFTCVPNATGRFDPRVTVWDAFGAVASMATNVTVGPAAPPPLAMLALIASPNPALAGERFQITTVVTGGAGPLRFGYSGLPGGCVSENSSELNCSTNVSGTYEVQATVADESGQMAHRAVNLTVETLAVTPLRIVSFTVTPATVAVGQVAVWAVVAEGGSGTITVLYAGLPTGCVNDTGPVVSCVPTVKGTYNTTATATDSAGHVSIAYSHLTVVPSAAPSNPEATSGVPWIWAAGLAATTFVVGGAAAILIRRGPRKD